MYYVVTAFWNYQVKFLSKSFRTNFVVSEILASFSGTCLCTCISLGTTKEDTSGHWFSQVPHAGYVSLVNGVQLALMVLGLLSYVISLMDTGYTDVSLQLRGLILGMCLFLGGITLLGLVLMMVHRRFIGSLVLNIKVRVLQIGFDLW